MNKPTATTVAKRVLFWIGLVFTLTAPLYSQLQLHDSTAAWIGLLCGAFVTLMAKYDEIAEFSFGPVKARMKETLSEAAATIKQLQQVALSQSTATLTDMMAGSFMGGTTFQTKIGLHDNLLAKLREIGLDETEIRQADEMWRRGMGVNYHREIRNALEGRTNPNQYNMNASPELRAACEDFQKMLDFPRWMAPSADEMESFIERKQFMNPTVAELISDYRHYLKTGEVKRKDVFDHKG